MLKYEIINKLSKSEISWYKICMKFGKYDKISEKSRFTVTKGAKNPGHNPKFFFVIW